MKFWYWLQPALGAALGLLTIYTIVMLSTQLFLLPSLQFVANGLFAFPGLLISLAVNQFAFRRRRPRAITRAERIMLVILVAIVIAMVAVSFDLELVGWALGFYPVLILYALSFTFVISYTSAGLVAQPAAHAEEEPEESGDDSLDELFGREDPTPPKE
ncbi:fatty acid desaturase [Microbacteriaceae bacterium SG_E_30_P1]|uniref:Fatty acid desaturase n=1 Tax=Antiquaquibacter oligotrophicus TaxID=2880260 RepID=A0ABT6KN43_9MICO|nr:hypothetical protein [Antiquaquibacter oligotrophicus]MDH6181431.1 fatty acid desaturase [Antiquaquibacter oligotrophicus]UDF12877.1 hypothetical protein LH407_12050 [Antiquaquibacter oligotrophicus]